jgi:4-hydroxymandelate oxidase
MVNLRDFETEARRRLDPTLFDYFAGGARDEVTVAANEAGFATLSLLPRVLAGACEPRLGCRPPTVSVPPRGPRAPPGRS